ncbi:hypothetical protein OCU04_003711 [Sclerotinia nivalis]|uniref:Uncharacterized protein n=1 Tax=Sclerotinia nivalis TaxID=352851 RepID=A0A9X0ASW7_9HELO|nr:hypothetical protein OCU04_003711 [Sclerotinia nivalis]
MLSKGHAMNNYGVTSSFLYADMAFTVAKHILEKGLPSSANIGMNVANFDYHEPVVKHRNPIEAQSIVVSVEADLKKGKPISTPPNRAASNSVVHAFKIIAKESAITSKY